MKITIKEKKYKKYKKLAKKWKKRALSLGWQTDPVTGTAFQTVEDTVAFMRRLFGANSEPQIRAE